MTSTLDTAAAARLAGATTAAVRSWCRRGAVAAVKVGRRWMVELSSLLRRLNAARPRPSDWLRRGERTPVLSGRALRRYEARHVARVGKHRAPTHRQRALVAYANRGHMTAVEFLAGIGFPEAERYASAFGRACAKAYRESHGAEPFSGCLVVVNGRMRHVFGYESVSDLYAGAYSYRRTREFLTAQRNQALAGPVAA